MNLLKNYLLKIKTSGLILVDQGLVSGTSFITGILLTRFLGLEAYGSFVLLWMVVLFGLSIAQALITKPMITFEPKLEKEEAKNYIGAVHSLQIMLSIFAILVSIIGLTILSELNSLINIDLSTILALSISTGLILIYDFYRKHFFLRNDVPAATFSDGVLAVLQLTGIFILHQFQLLTITNFLWLVAFVYTIVCIIGCLKNERPDFRSSAIIQIFYKHYNFSKWLLGTVALQWLSGNFFIIAAGGILGAAAVGAVRIAQNVIGLTHVIFLAMENIVPIQATKAFKNGGQKKLFAYLKSTTIQIGWGVLLILVFTSIFAPQILELLYGAKYLPFSYILIGFCLIYLLVYIGYPLRFALRTLELTKPIFIAYVVSAAFSLLAATYMLESWGIYGLLVGLFINQLLSQFVYIISLWKIKRYYEGHSLGTR